MEQIGFPFLDDQPRTAWNTRYGELDRYRKENDGWFLVHKDDPDLKRWMRQQHTRLRSEYGYVGHLDDQKSPLKSIRFPMIPKTNIAKSLVCKAR